LLRALDAVGRVKDYSLFFANCEHFATWVVTGVHDSSQIDGMLAVLGIAVGGAAAGKAAWAHMQIPSRSGRSRKKPSGRSRKK
jgi:hypothetical protein